MEPFHLLIKPAGPDCNLQCDYCFYRQVMRLFPDRGAARRMSPKVLDEMTKQYLGLNFPVSVLAWQGGEPSLCGLTFFERAVELQKKYGKSGQIVSNAFQTNGLLIDKDWCQFFRKYKFLIGLSLDGPKNIHDCYRKSDGQSSWEMAMRTAKLLTNHKVEFNILSVVTRKSEGRARALFNWFIGKGFRYLQFIPCLERMPKGGLTPFSVTQQGYADFLCELFDVWWNNRSQGISIRMFDTLLQKVITGKQGLCNFAPVCRSYLVIEHDGTIYPCDFFVRKDTCLGNLLEVSLYELFNTELYREFGNRKSILSDECRECEWFSLCRGGCQKDRMDAQDRVAPRTYFCQAYRQFFQHAMPKINELAKKIPYN